MSLVSTSDSAKRVDINYRQGTDFVKTITVVNSLDSSNFDFTGYDANLYIRKFSGSTPLVTFGVGTGITLSLGQILLQKADDDAELSLLAVENYYYELELIDTGTLKRVWLNGKFSIHNNIEDQTPNNIAVTVSTDPDSIALTVVNIIAGSSISDFPDVTITSPADNDMLHYNGTVWNNVPLGLRVIARNNTGVTITKGQAVYVTGAISQNPTVALAKADAEATHKGILGVAVADIANNTTGDILTEGALKDLNTTDFNDGDTLWLSATTAGGLTNVEPITPNHAIRIGICVYSHVSNGILNIRVGEGFELGELHDVLITSIATNDYIKWDGSKWVNISGTESIVIACSDESTDLTTGTKVTFRMPYAFTLTDVRASVTTAPTGVILIADINDSGVSILSTKLSIDAGEKTSTTATTPVVISDTALANDAEITIDIDQIGSTIAGTGLKVTLIGYKV